MGDRVKGPVSVPMTAPAREGKKPVAKADRKSVIEMLRQEKYNVEFRSLFREKFGKMSVECPAFPDLENVDGVSPLR